MQRREICILGLTLSLVQHTNVQSNCPVLWDQKITKLPIELQGSIGENSAGCTANYKHSQNISYIIGLAGHLQYHITGTERILIGKSTI